MDGDKIAESQNLSASCYELILNKFKNKYFF